jgi:hypothetical protein
MGSGFNTKASNWDENEPHGHGMKWPKVRWKIFHDPLEFSMSKIGDDQCFMTWFETVIKKIIAPCRVSMTKFQPHGAICLTVDMTFPVGIRGVTHGLENPVPGFRIYAGAIRSKRS